MVFVGKGLGQKDLSFIVLLERLDGIFPAELEGKDKVRSQLSGKLVGDLPVSWGKFWGMFAGIAALLSIVGSIGAMLLMR